MATPLTIVPLPPGRYVIAVSGGVDSMVLLALVAQQIPVEQLIVAHFDHGIRPDSTQDALFVKQAAARYGIRYLSQRAALGENASEALARAARYAFLQSLAALHSATIITAHHADDVIETMAINFIRGTGWRGIAALRSQQIVRPFLGFWKVDILAYAAKQHITWREDSTNKDTRYLRNRVRIKVSAMPQPAKQALLTLHDKQVVLKQAIEDQAATLAIAWRQSSHSYRRYPFIMADLTTSDEVLRAILHYECQWTPTRPQRAAILVAIKTFRSGARFILGPHYWLLFTTNSFIVQRAEP